MSSAITVKRPSKLNGTAKTSIANARRSSKLEYMMKSPRTAWLSRATTTFTSIVLVATGASILLSSSEAQAIDISQVGVGVARTVTLGNYYAAFGSTTGFYAEALTTGLDNSLGSAFKIHAAVEYQRYTLKNTTSSAYNLMSFGIGLTVQQPTGNGSAHGRGHTPHHLTTVSPFFSLLLGGAVDWLSLNATNASVNASFGGSAQVIPGIEFPIVDRLTGALSFPTQAFLLGGKQLYIWNALFHLRWAL